MRSIENRYTIPTGSTRVPLWMEEARTRKKIHSKRGNPPFVFPVGDAATLVGEGSEQVVYSVQERNIVVKESKTAIPAEITHALRVSMGKGFEDFLTWKEVQQVRQSDFDFMAEVFGENLLPTYLVHGYASHDPQRETNYAIQELVTGNMFADLSEERRRELYQDETFRNQMLRVLWGYKKTAVTLGSGPDLSNGTNIFYTPDGRLLLTDPSCPSLLSAIAKSDIFPLVAKELLSIFSHDIELMHRTEKDMEVTSEEIQRLSSQFQVTEDEYQMHVKDVTGRLQAHSFIGDLGKTAVNKIRSVFRT